MSHCIFNMSKSTCTIRMLLGLWRKGMAVLEGKQTIYMRGGMAYMIVLSSVRPSKKTFSPFIARRKSAKNGW